MDLERNACRRSLDIGCCLCLNTGVGRRIDRRPVEEEDNRPWTTDHREGIDFRP
jgi:hypothetical protein